MKHTPGKWEVAALPDDERQLFIKAGPWFVCEVTLNCDANKLDDLDAETIANARLIAKAPEMYELLQEWLGEAAVYVSKELIAKTEQLLSEIDQ